MQSNFIIVKAIIKFIFYFFFNFYNFIWKFGKIKYFHISTFPCESLRNTQLYINLFKSMSSFWLLYLQYFMPSALLQMVVIFIKSVYNNLTEVQATLVSIFFKTSYIYGLNLFTWQIYCQILSSFDLLLESERQNSFNLLLWCVNPESCTANWTIFTNPFLCFVC